MAKKERKKILNAPKKKIVKPTDAQVVKFANEKQMKEVILKEMMAGEKFENDLTSSTLVTGGNPFFTEQLSKFGTIEKNLRYYMITNLRQLLSWAYVEIGLVQTICDLPVDDGLRGGVEIHTGQLSADEIEELTMFMEEQDDLTVAEQAAKWNRLYGGAGIIVASDADPSEEFDEDEIQEGGKLGFRSCDLWELFWAHQFATTGDEILDVNTYDSDTFSFYGIEVNRSRVMPMNGIPVPSFLRPTLRGWGASVVETLIRSINQYLKNNDLIFEVIDEFKIDIFKLKNLANTLIQKNGTTRIQNRIQLANMQKNYQNAVVLDSEDSFESKELSFTGIADTMQGIRMQVASDMRIPLTKLFGISAAGFSSGQDDIENYNAMIESTIRRKLKFHIIKMIKLRCKQMFGFVPDDLRIEFKSLRILSAVDEEAVKTAKHGRLLATAAAGLCSVKEFKEGCNKDKLLPIQLDDSVDSLDEELINASNKSEASVPTPEGGASSQAPAAKNSIENEVYHSSADRYKIMNPGKVDESKWEAAKRDVMKEYGKMKWAVVTDVYKKMGGTFK